MLVSVTAPSREGARLQIRQGEVVTTGPTKPVEQAIKGSTKVYQLDREVIAELKAGGMLR